MRCLCQADFFDYEQYKITTIAETIESQIRSNNIKNEWDYANDYPQEVLDQFQLGKNILEIGAIYAQRIDWLLSSDDGPDTFLERLSEDLSKLGYTKTQLIELINKLNLESK